MLYFKPTGQERKFTKGAALATARHWLNVLAPVSLSMLSTPCLFEIQNVFRKEMKNEEFQHTRIHFQNLLPHSRLII